MIGPLKIHGGKHYLASKMVRLMPPHLSYVEAYCGGCAVLLAKNPNGVSEVINDLDYQLTNFWNVLQCDESYKLFVRVMEAMPFSEYEFQEALHKPTGISPIDDAANFFIVSRQSLAGRNKSFAPLSKTRIRRGMNEQAAAWISAVDGLPAVHERLRRVVIRNTPAIELIESLDAKTTLFYLDPPYLPSTRSTVGEYGEFEMTLEQHIQLLETVVKCVGFVMLSGYHSELYDEYLRGWNVHKFNLPNNAAAGKTKERKQELVYCNF